MYTYITGSSFQLPLAVNTLRSEADIILDIPKQGKVTQPMLISAQNWVAKALQDEWYGTLSYIMINYTN